MTPTIKEIVEQYDTLTVSDKTGTYSIKITPSMRDIDIRYKFHALHGIDVVKNNEGWVTAVRYLELEWFGNDYKEK